MRRIAVVLALLGLAAPALAFEFEPVKPLDTREVDPALLKGAFGAYEIRDKAGKKRCRIVLTQQQAIGGYAVELAPDCAKAFPVMADIAGWRLLEGWTVDLIDPLRKTRVRFSTPDARYIPSGNPVDIAGMDELRKLPDAGAKPRR
jgi:hypothetical protein